MRGNRWVKASWVVAIAFVTGGCTVLDRALCSYDCGKSRSGSSSSLVGFLYPGGEVPAAEDAIPELRVPMRVGLTFLPDTAGGAGVDAAQRAEVLERIRQRFLARKFIAEIVVIPDYYLTHKTGLTPKTGLTHNSGQSGFDSLAGLQRLYNLDLLALVSHDQVTYTDENSLSLTYLTIVGAYIFPGSKHEVTTLVDLAIVDPKTRSLLLRAGGTNAQERTTTLVDQEPVARGTRQKSFSAASDQMIEHFDAALAQFEDNVRSGKASVKVTRRDGGGGGGGGSMDVMLIVAALGLVAARLRRRTTAIAR
ncbi:MAG TPA: rhombotarget lipoprotein [Steroidobacteraceae bacterium]|nr:rhombotarget lipoprotein [Steroidobacteraceae bacterium]